MGLYQSKQNDVITLFLDVGNEIDDEQLARYIENIQSLNKLGWKVEIVFCGSGKLSDEDSLKRWLSEFKFPGETFQDFLTAMSKDDFLSMEIAPGLRYTQLNEYISRESCETDYALVCASVKGWDASNFTVNKMLFFQGDVEDTTNEEGKVTSPKGLNAVGADAFIVNMKAKLQERFVVVPSTRCAMMRPTAKYLKCLPKHFKSATAEAGFKLMVGRISPNIVLPNGSELSKKVAAGLINKNRGRGANIDAMIAFMSLMGADLMTDFEPPKYSGVSTRSGSASGVLEKPAGKFFNQDKYDQSHTLAENYFLEIFDIQELTDTISFNDADPDGNIISVEYDWDKAGSIANLTRIHQALDHICPGIWDGKSLPFYSNFTLKTKDESLEKLRGLYLAELDKVDDNTQIGMLNPSYDLFVGYVFNSFVKGGHASMSYALTEATPQEFFNEVSF